MSDVPASGLRLVRAQESSRELPSLLTERSSRIARSTNATAPSPSVTVQSGKEVKITPAPCGCRETHPRLPSGLCRGGPGAVSYTHLRAHETDSYLVCR